MAGADEQPKRTTSPAMLSFSKNYVIQSLMVLGFVLYTSLDLLPLSVRRSLGYTLFSTIILAAIGFASKSAFQKVSSTHLKIAITLIWVAYLPLMRSLGWIFAYDSLIIAYLYLTGIWIMAVSVNERTRGFLLTRFHFLVYVLLAWTAAQAFIEIRSSDIVYTFGRFVRLPFQINYGLVSKSQNHFSLLIAGLVAYAILQIPAKITRILMVVAMGFLLLIMDSFFALLALVLVVFFNRVIIRNKRLFLGLLFVFPFVFLAISETVAGNLGITNERIVTLNNRSHIWGGLLHYISNMNPLEWLVGNGYFGNFNEETKAQYTLVFGKGFSGARTAHSTIIQLFLDTGILGCVLVYRLLLAFYRRINTTDEESIGALVSVFLIGGFLESIFQMYDPLLFGVLLFSILLMVGSPKSTNDAVELHGEEAESG